MTWSTDAGHAIRKFTHYVQLFKVNDRIFSTNGAIKQVEKNPPSNEISTHQNFQTNEWMKNIVSMYKKKKKKREKKMLKQISGSGHLSVTRCLFICLSVFAHSDAYYRLGFSAGSR